MQRKEIEIVFSIVIVVLFVLGFFFMSIFNPGSNFEKSLNLAPSGKDFYYFLDLDKSDELRDKFITKVQGKRELKLGDIHFVLVFGEKGEKNMIIRSDYNAKELKRSLTDYRSYFERGFEILELDDSWILLNDKFILLATNEDVISQYLNVLSGKEKSFKDIFDKEINSKGFIIGIELDKPCKRFLRVKNPNEAVDIRSEFRCKDVSSAESLSSNFIEGRASYALYGAEIDKKEVVGSKIIIEGSGNKIKVIESILESIGSL